MRRSIRRRAPVRVWIVGFQPSGELGLEACWERLSLPEQARALGFEDQGEHSRFIRAHGALRLLLGTWLGQEPRRLPLSCPPGEPPRLLSDTPVVHCSLAHSEDFVICAAGPAPVGVDVERVRGMTPSDTLLRRECTDQERRRLYAAAPAARERLFIRAWTRKEALSKAVGRGHALSFAALESGSRRARVKGTTLTLVDLDLPESYAGSLAVSGRRPRIEITRTEPASPRPSALAARAGSGQPVRSGRG